MAQRLAPLLADVDVGIVNLEAVLNADDLTPRSLNGLGDIVAAPASALEYLASLRFRILSLANNHAFDFGPSGVAQTRAALATHRLVPLGVGRTLRQNPEISVWHGPGNLRVGFWAAARATYDPSTRHVAGVEPAMIARVRQAISALRAQDAHFCIALLHAGCLRTSHPDPEDVRLLDAIAAQGFDLVGASHSHRISGARYIPSLHRPAFCLYGLGSLVSGFISCPLESEGLIAVAELSATGSLLRLDVRPVTLTSSGWGAVPSIDQASSILSRFDSLSRQIEDGSFARAFYRDMSDGMIGLYWRDVRAALRHSGVAGLIRKVGRLRIRHVRRLVRAVAG